MKKRNKPWTKWLGAWMLGFGIAAWAQPESNSVSAVTALLQEAKGHFAGQHYERAAATLERALRIDSRNAILWHNLAGVRLQQEDWKKAASLASKSNSLAVNDRHLRIRNWMLIALACEGLNDTACVTEARRRAQALARRLG